MVVQDSPSVEMVSPLSSLFTSPASSFQGASDRRWSRERVVRPRGVSVRRIRTSESVSTRCGRLSRSASSVGLDGTRELVGGTRLDSRTTRRRDDSKCCLPTRLGSSTQTGVSTATPTEEYVGPPGERATRRRPSRLHRTSRAAEPHRVLLPIVEEDADEQSACVSPGRPDFHPRHSRLRSDRRSR